LNVLGRANVAKALIYFVFPAVGLCRLQFISHKRASLVAGGEVIFLLLAGLLSYHVWSTSPPGEMSSAPMHRTMPTRQCLSSSAGLAGDRPCAPVTLSAAAGIASNPCSLSEYERQSEANELGFGQRIATGN
jgi:hypothetical protein